MKAYAQVGNTATTPYCFKKLGVSVYTMEELCYVLKENAFLLGTDIMEDEFIDFIGKQCGLPELARELYPLAHQKGTLSNFVSLIQSFVGFYGKEEIARIENTLKMSSGMSDYQKRKMQIDYLVEKQRYNAAIDAYDVLLQEMDTIEPEILRANALIFAGIWHNKGVALAGLMRHEEAGECFLKAYEMNGDNGSFMAFLGTKRLTLSQTEYVALVAEYGKQYEECLVFEKKFDKLNDQWEQTPEYLRLKEMRSRRIVGDQNMYYSESENVVQLLKNTYRGIVGVL